MKVRDLNQIVGSKIKVDSFESALRLVRESYPAAMATGSIGAYSFLIGEKIVGEMWIQARGNEWWLRILKK